jgi:membrane protease YdiL (CAAX protease family)
MGKNTDVEGFADLPVWKVVPMALGTIVWVLLIIVATEVVSNFTSGYVPDSVPDILNYSLVGLVVATLALVAYARVVTRRPLRWYAFSDPDRSMVGWAAFGIALPTAIALSHVLVQGGAVVETISNPPGVVGAILGSVGIALFTAGMEEFTFRGIAYRLLEDKWNPAVAILAPALVFSVLHTGRADSQVELWLVVIRTVLGGIMFGLIVYRTRNIWNAIAVHAGWNFLLGARIVRIAGPESAPDTALVSVALAEAGPLGTAVNPTNSPITIGFLLLACVALLFRFDGRIGLGTLESNG